MCFIPNQVRARALGRRGEASVELRKTWKEDVSYPQFTSIPFIQKCFLYRYVYDMKPHTLRQEILCLYAYHWILSVLSTIAAIRYCIKCKLRIVYHESILISDFTMTAFLEFGNRRIKQWNQPHSLLPRSAPPLRDSRRRSRTRRLWTSYLCVRLMVYTQRNILFVLVNTVKYIFGFNPCELWRMATSDPYFWF